MQEIFINKLINLVIESYIRDKPEVKIVQKQTVQDEFTQNRVELPKIVKKNKQIKNQLKLIILSQTNISTQILQYQRTNQALAVEEYNKIEKSIFQFLDHYFSKNKQAPLKIFSNNFKHISTNKQYLRRRLNRNQMF